MARNLSKLVLLFIGTIFSIPMFADDVDYVTTSYFTDDDGNAYKKTDIKFAGVAYDFTINSETSYTVAKGSSEDDGTVTVYPLTNEGLENIALSASNTTSTTDWWWRYEGSSSNDWNSGILLYYNSSEGAFAITDLKEGDVVYVYGYRFHTNSCAAYYSNDRAEFYGASSVDGVEQTPVSGNGEATYTVTHLTESEAGKYSNSYTAVGGVKIEVTSDGYVGIYCYNTSTSDANWDGFISEVEIVTASEAQLYTYTLSAVCDGKTLKTYDSQQTANDSYTFTGLSEVLEVDGVYYQLSDDNVEDYCATFELEEESQTTVSCTVNYVVNENIAYYVEEGTGTVSGTSSSDNYSGGSAAYYSATTSGTYYANPIIQPTLSEGYYNLNVKRVSLSGSSAQTLVVYVGQADNYGSHDIEIEPSSTPSLETVSINILEDDSEVLLAGVWSKTDYIDYISIEKVTGQEYSVELDELGIATFSAPVAVSVPDGITVYSASLDEENSKLTLTALSTTVIPANTGVIIQGAEGTYKFSQTDSESTEISGNDLIAASATVTASTTLLADAGYYAMTTNDDNDVVFGKVAAEITITNKAYLQLSTESSDDDDSTSEAKTISIVFAETTGIESVSSEKTTDGSYYNLQGVKVLSPSKGLYIKDGKKVIIK